MVLQLKIQLKGITKPPVWRKVLVPGQITFHQLHQVIQTAFGWNGYHLYQFSPSGYGSKPELGLIDKDWSDESLEDAQKTQLRQYLFEKGQKFQYLYDFGDDWTHQITVEEVLEEVRIFSELVSGKGACPPEDCGGAWGYEELKNILANPKHREYKNMREWLGMGRGEHWDPSFFDLQAAKAAVSMLNQ